MLTRFAPSPTGYLHIGHALAARRAFDFAHEGGGTCLLRIEDIDHTRCKPEYTDAIYEDLIWLSFDWPKPVRVQSEHRAEYDGVIDSLRARGLIYRCFKSRAELPKGIYHGPETHLSQDQEAEKIAQNQPFAWRLSMMRAKDILGAEFHLCYHDNGKAVTSGPARHGDIVLARKDIGTSYHIAAVHDDHVQGITDVVRGRDLQGQTDIHVLLQRLMGWETPRYHHHALLMNEAGQKLSKRNRDTTVRALRGSGHSPASVFDMARL